jgi:hypothetical protein
MKGSIFYQYDTGYVMLCRIYILLTKLISDAFAAYGSSAEMLLLKSLKRHNLFFALIRKHSTFSTCPRLSIAHSSYLKHFPVLQVFFAVTGETVNWFLSFSYFLFNLALVSLFNLVGQFLGRYTDFDVVACLLFSYAVFPSSIDLVLMLFLFQAHKFKFLYL